MLYQLEVLQRLYVALTIFGHREMNETSLTTEVHSFGFEGPVGHGDKLLLGRDIEVRFGQNDLLRVEVASYNPSLQIHALFIRISDHVCVKCEHFDQDRGSNRDPSSY